MDIHYAETFACRPSVLFGWLADPQKAMKWMKGVSSARILTETKERVGTTFTETLGEGARRIEMSGEISEYQEDSLIAFHLRSPVNVLDVRYEVEPAGGTSAAPPASATAESTALSVTSTIRWRFPVNVMSLFAGRKVKQGILAELRAELSELRKLCEQA